MRPDVTSLSRSGATNPLGKLSAEIKVRVPEATHDALEQQARTAGMGLSEFLREILLIRAHGIDMVRSLYEARLALVAGTGPECSRDGNA
jgi:hypothetical protein